MELQKRENKYLKIIHRIRSIKNIIKRERDKILMMIVGFLSYGYFLSTLVTTFLYYVSFLIISLIICVLWSSFKKLETNFEKFVIFFKIYLILYFLFFSMIYIVNLWDKPQPFIVPLNSYSTAKTDAIYFSFCNNKFKRYYNISKYPLDSLINNYKVQLNLSQPLPHIYYIKSIELSKMRE